jgi:hypothetical protein
MTSLHERIDLDFDLDDTTFDDTEPAVALGDRDSDVRARDDITAALARPKSLRTWIMNALGRVRGAFARPPRPARPAKKHYPPRFSVEFETSLVDRERRRL